MAIQKEINIVVKETGIEKVNKQMDDLANSLKKADKEVTNLDASFAEVYGDLQPLTTRMGEAEDRLYELGLAGKQASKEYQDLLKQVGNYRKVQIQTDLAVDSAASNLSQNLTGALGAVTGGFSVAQGAMGAFGITSESTEEALLKVQSAMAISSGFETIKQGSKSFGALRDSIMSTNLVTKINTASTATAVIVQKAFTGSVATTTTGFKLLRGAIIATGIGALVVGIGLLISNFDKIKQVVLNFVPGLAKVGDTIMGIVNAVTDFIGVTSKAGRALDDQKALAEKALKQNELYLKKNEHKLSEARKRELELTNEHFQRLADGEMTKEESLKIFREKTNIDKQKSDDEANKKALEKQKEAYEKMAEANRIADEKEKARKQKAFENENNFVAEQLKNEKLTIDEKRRIVIDSKELSYEDQQKFLGELHNEELAKEKDNAERVLELKKSYAMQLEDLQATTAEQKLALEEKRALEELSKLEYNEEAKLELIKFYQQKKDDLASEKKKEEEEKAIEQKEIDAENEELDFETRFEKLNEQEKLISESQFLNAEEKAKKLLEIEKKKIDLEKSMKQALHDQSIEFGNNILAIGGALAKKGSKLAKGVAIAQATMNTYQGVTKALAETTDVTPSQTLRFANAAAVGIMGAINIAKIVSAKEDGGGVSAGGSTPAPPPAPSFNLVQGTGRNQIAEGIQNQSPLKAYVVAKDVTTGQSMDRNIIEDARL